MADEYHDSLVLTENTAWAGVPETTRNEIEAWSKAAGARITAVGYDVAGRTSPALVRKRPLGRLSFLLTLEHGLGRAHRTGPA